MKNYYGNFADWKGSYSDVPAFVISTDPEHMTEIVGHGFPIAGIITPNRTHTLDKIEKESDTKVFAYSDLYEKVTGKKYFIPMSEESLSRKVTNQSFTGEQETAYSKLHDPLREWFSRDVISYIQERVDSNGRGLLFPYMISNGLKGIEQKINGNLNIIAPSLEIKEKLGNKAEVYKGAKERGINVIEGDVADNVQEACEIFRENKSYWDNGAFVSAESGAGGSGCIHAYNEQDIVSKFYSDESGKFIVEEWLNGIIAAPNVLLFIDDNKPSILSITDQIIENGTNYAGNVYPLNIEKDLKEKVKRESLKVGEYMRDEGYRGIGGLDFVVNNHNAYFVEINPRKNHSSVLNISLLEKFRPEEMAPISYLEADLFLSDKDKEYNFADWVSSIDSNDLSWEMYLFRREGWLNLIPDSFDLGRDHDWDFSTTYIANLPNTDGQKIIFPKSYSSLKSEGFTKEINQIEIGRIVSTNIKGRLRQMGKMNKSIKVCR